MTDLAWIAAFTGLVAAAFILIRLLGYADGERP